MATSVNNVAATFATVPLSSSSSSPSSHPTATSSLSLPLKPLPISWNPHSSLPKSRTSSFLAIYGPPGPRPFRSVPAVHPRPPIASRRLIPIPIPIPIGGRLPSAALSYLDRNGKVRNVTVLGLGRGKKLAIVGVSAAFSASCERYVRAAAAARARAVDLIACVAVNDVYVMRAWGSQLGLGEKVLMLSDVEGELARGLGLCLDTGDNRPRLGVVGGMRSKRFCLSALNGVITNVSVDEEGGGDDGVENGGEVGLLPTKINGCLKIV